MKFRLFYLVILVSFLACSFPSRPVWKWALESRCYAQPIIDGENVYIVSQAGEVISGKYMSGKKNWSIKVDGPILADPDYSESILFTSTQNGFVYALDKKSGKVIWKVNHPQEHFVAPLTYSPELLLAPSSDGNLYALSPHDGSTKWKITGNRKYNTKAIIHGKYIFIGDWADNFYCLNMNGTVNWRYKASHVIVQPALIKKNVVYFTAHDHYVYALEVPTGKMIWRFQATYPTDMVFIDDLLVFGSRAQVLALDSKTGKLVTKINYNKRSIERMYEWNGRCIAVSKEILEFDLHKGKIRRLIPSKGPFFKIAFPAGMFVVSSDYNQIFGYPND